MEFPSASSTSTFSFSMSSTQDMEGPGGSFECMTHMGPPRGPLELLNSIPNKIRIHANDDIYAATKQRMTVAEETHKNKWWVVLENFFEILIMKFFYKSCLIRKLLILWMNNLSQGVFDAEGDKVIKFLVSIWKFLFWCFSELHFNLIFGTPCIQNYKNFMGNILKRGFSIMNPTQMKCWNSFDKNYLKGYIVILNIKT